MARNQNKKIKPRRRK